METMENNTVSSTHQEKAKKMRKLRRWQIIVSLFGVAVIVWGVIEIVFLFLGYKQTETSNDAQIEQYVSPVNLRASGYINKIYFTEHQQVRKGDTLLVLDDREYKIRVMEAAVGVNFHFYLSGTNFFVKALNNLNVMAEYDSRTINCGLKYSFWKDYINAVVEMTECKHLSGGVIFKVHLK